MKDRIIEMLERGERVELECIDRDGFFGETLLLRDLLNTSLIVVGMNKYFKLLQFKDTHQTLSFDHLKYFKIKEPTYTFNDLIDVVVQAYKDGVIPSLELGSEMGVRSVRCLASAILDEWDDYSNGVNNIKSLCTETFVIESEEDMYRIGDEYEIVLLNGEDVSEMIIVTENYPYTSYGDRLIPVSFEFLKGATVTQKRGN